jgi:hypothetical protein
MAEDENQVEHVELIPSAPPVADGEGAGDEGATEYVSEPAKVMRVGSMIKQLLEEVRTTTLDEPSRVRLRLGAPTKGRRKATAPRTLGIYRIMDRPPS